VPIAFNKKQLVAPVRKTGQIKFATWPAGLPINKYIIDYSDQMSDREYCKPYAIRLAIG
jgi:hypothetical protein